MLPARPWPTILACAALGCGTSTSGRGPAVDDITIRGARQVSEEAIKKKLVTEETPWWPFARRRLFDPVVWRTDLERVRRYYNARGYYEARVLASEIVGQPKGRVDLMVTVEENEPVRIASVQIDGLEELPPEEREDVLEDLPLEPGAILAEDNWQEAKRLVHERLRQSGYAESHVAGRADIDIGTDLASLRIDATPGPRYRFGELRVDLPAAAAIDRRHISDQARLGVPEGQTFSDEALAEAQRRVLAMGVFASARARAGKPDPEGGTLPVIIEARPAPFRLLRLGVGVGIDQVRDEVHGLADWSHRNFLGGLRRLTLRGRAGWAFVPGFLSASETDQAVGSRHGPIYRVGAELEQPRFVGRPSLRLRTLVESERTIEQAYDAIGGRGLLGIEWMPTTAVALFPSYNVQGYYLRGPRAQGLRSAPLVLGCREDPCGIALSFLEQTLTWDRRDDPLEPRRGTFVFLSLQEGGGPLGGAFDYLRVMPEARGYLTPGDEGRFTFAARLRAGTLLTGAGDPDASAVVTRFTSGGSQSMRGFGMRRLSPLLLAPPPQATPDAPLVTIPIGGNGLLEGSVEARWRTSERLVGALFVDFGTVTRRRLPLPRPTELLYAVGLGLRYLSGIGPIRIDLAVRLPVGRPPPLFDLDGNEITYQRLPGGGTVRGRESGDHVNDSCFGIGGSRGATWVPDGLCAIHISIGEAF